MLFRRTLALYAGSHRTQPRAWELPSSPNIIATKSPAVVVGPIVNGIVNVNFDVALWLSPVHVELLAEASSSDGAPRV